jgi:mannose-6-phosphate isomerase
MQTSLARTRQRIVLLQRSEMLILPSLQEFIILERISNLSTITASHPPISEPFRIAPQFVERVWGWTNLAPWFAKLASGNPIGEVWLTGDECVAETGPWNGQKLSDIFAEHRDSLVGSSARVEGSPLLIKVIFAREKLSVQVHPDDAMAQKYGSPRGKTECWYALAADPGARVACGLKRGVTAEMVRAGIADGSLEQDLNAISINAGDMIFVDAGTVHAIWPGSVILETQQNSDITYRMFDYGRPRELHIEKSLEAMRLATQAGKVEPRALPDRTILVDAEYFRVERIEVKHSITNAELRATDEGAPPLSYLFAASGQAEITGSFEQVSLPTCGIVAVPAQSQEFAVSGDGAVDLIRVVAK